MHQDQNDIYRTAAAMSSLSEQNIGFVLQTLLSNNQEGETGRLLNPLIEQAIAFGSNNTARDALQFILNPRNKQTDKTKFDFLAGLFKMS